MLSKQAALISAATVLVQQTEAVKIQNQNKFFGFPHMSGFGSSMFGNDDFFADPFKDSFNAFHNIEEDMHRMQDQMSHQPIGGNTKSQSFSKSISSEMGQDGKMHSKEQQSGSKTDCVDGHCKVLECANGKCQEKEEEVSPQAEAQQRNQLLHSTPS